MDRLPFLESASTKRTGLNFCARRRHSPHATHTRHGIERHIKKWPGQARKEGPEVAYGAHDGLFVAHKVAVGAAPGAPKQDRGHVAGVVEAVDCREEGSVGRPPATTWTHYREWMHYGPQTHARAEAYPMRRKKQLEEDCR